MFLDIYFNELRQIENAVYSTLFGGVPFDSIRRNTRDQQVISAKRVMTHLAVVDGIPLKIIAKYLSMHPGTVHRYSSMFIPTPIETRAIAQIQQLLKEIQP